jgi:NhaP-type Na+/H+ or K+/H+ antiporter
VATWVVTTWTATVVLGFDGGLSMLLGAVLVVTGPTVILPLLRLIRPKGRVGPVLKWEGIVIDPIGALLAVLVFEVIVASEGTTPAALIGKGVAFTIVFGGGFGCLGAVVLAFMLRRYWIPEFLQNAVSLMLVIAAFAASNVVQPESGLLAATVMGIVLANQKWADVRHIVEFKENLRVLLISALFILLAARIQPSQLTGVGWRGVIFVIVLIVVIRPVAVWLSTLRSRLTRSERMFLAWMAPRGIVAAAVSSVFAFRLEEQGLADAHLLVPITFITIMGTVAVYGLTAPIVARRVGVADMNPQGLLIVGADRWIRAVAETLQKKGISVLLVDTNRQHASAARMAGLRVYNGSVLADHALEELDLGGLGKLLAVTSNDWVNVLAVQRFSRIFGAAECYQIPSWEEGEGRKPRHQHLRGRLVFADTVTSEDLQQRFEAGDVVKATPISEAFDYAAFTQRYGESALPLFVVSDDGKLDVLTARHSREPKAGETLIAMVSDTDPTDPGGET